MMEMIAISLAVLLAIAMVTDLKSYIIPNWVVLCVMALYAAWFFLSPVPLDWQAALLGFGITFVVGFALFAFKIAGGGDIKLLMACSLWASGKVAMLNFLFIMSLVGAVLGIVLLVGRKYTLPTLAMFNTKKTLPRILLEGEPLPYGLAIGSAMIWLLFKGNGMISGLDLSGLF